MRNKPECIDTPIERQRHIGAIEAIIGMAIAARDIETIFPGPQHASLVMQFLVAGLASGIFGNGMQRITRPEQWNREVLSD